MGILKKLTLAICVLTLIQTTGFAQTNIGLKSVGGHIGIVSPEHYDTSVELGGVVGLGTLMPNLQLEGNLDFWRKSQSSGDITAAFTDISFGGTVNYFVDINNPNLRPFGSAGLAFHILHSSVDAPTQTFNGITVGGGSSSDSKTRLGLNIGGGVAYRVSPTLDLIGKLKYHLVSDINQLTITVGASVPI